MRRIEQNLGEKRVLLGSLDRKNNLRLAYQRLNLEEKAFISSTQFNRRQLLSRQTKLRQLQSREQAANKGSSLETRIKTSTSFPGLTRTNEGASRGYFNSLTQPYSRNVLPSVTKSGNRENNSLGKDSHGKQGRLHSSQRHSYGHKKVSDHSDGALDDIPTEKRCETNVQSGQKVRKVEKTVKSGQAGVNVDDILAYSSRYRRKTEKSPGKSSTDHEDGVRTGSIVEKQAFWKSDFEISTSIDTDSFNTTSCDERENMNSIKHNQSFEKNFSDVKNRPGYKTNDSSSLRLSSEKIETGKESGPGGNVTRVASFNNSQQLSRDDYLKESNSLSEIQLIAFSSTLEDQPVQKTSGLDDDSSGNFTSECTSGQVIPLVSRTPSWHVTEALPVLGRIRRGSFCDVKTFTSGKVLDLLSSCEIPGEEKKNSKNLLDVEDENLKYCRYLRSVTPERAVGEDGDSLDIPLKYRPSKNIIIGHTKVSPQFKD